MVSGKDGIELMNEIPVLADLPVIFISGRLLPGSSICHYSCCSYKQRDG